MIDSIRNEIRSYLKSVGCDEAKAQKGLSLLEEALDQPYPIEEAIAHWYAPHHRVTILEMALRLRSARFERADLDAPDPPLPDQSSFIETCDALDSLINIRVGSDKQKRWAIAIATSAAQQLARSVECGEMSYATAAAVMQHQSASWWIDNRSQFE